MHIPDNYLSPQTCAVMGGLMLPVWVIAVKKVKSEVTAKKMPILGISAALSFLIMMFNIPLPGGTTGHAVGAALVAILLGPWPAVIAVSTALLIQALLFGDGGVLAFGANCFNMAFVMPFTGYLIYILITRIAQNEKWKYPAAFLAGYLSINIAAFCAAVEFGIQPFFFKDAAGFPLYCPYPLSATIPAMMIPHLLAAGFLDALITAGVLAFISRVSPELIHADKPFRKRPLYILLGLLAVLTPVGLIASGTAWGEWGKEEILKIAGFIPEGMIKGFNFPALLPDYTVKGLNHVAGYLISAVFGIAILLILFKFFSGSKKEKNGRKLDG